MKSRNSLLVSPSAEHWESCCPFSQRPRSTQTCGRQRKEYYVCQGAGLGISRLILAYPSSLTRGRYWRCWDCSLPMAWCWGLKLYCDGHFLTFHYVDPSFSGFSPGIQSHQPFEIVPGRCGLWLICLIPSTTSLEILIVEPASHSTWEAEAGG